MSGTSRSSNAAAHASHGAFTTTASVAEAVVVKDGDIFLLTDHDGDIPLADGHGLGLYYHDCRFLNGYELRVGGRRPITLLATAADGYRAAFQLTNPALSADAGAVGRETLGIRWERTLDGKGLALRERLTIHNFALDRVTVPVELSWSAAFEDVFTVRGMAPSRQGRLSAPRWVGNDRLVFRYDGADGIVRTSTIVLDPAPSSAEQTMVEFTLAIESGSERVIDIALSVAESDSGDDGRPPAHSDVRGISRDAARATRRWLDEHATVSSDDAALVRVVERSLRDLRTLATHLRGHRYFAAGVPWYVALFGRDSCLAAMQTTAWEPTIAADTLRVLAAYQGDRHEPERDEEPGKILHELRVGEMAHLHEIPQTPYYGSIDSTLLFLVLLVHHATCTGSLRLFDELRDNVERALAWIEHATDERGYLAYRGSSRNGALANQGWKDSGDAISNADGSLAEPPIALIEVQGYLYRARIGLADLYARAGDAARAQRLRQAADALARRVNEDFWLEDLGTYALALQKNWRAAAVVASNAGQALWSGIVSTDHAAAVVHRLMADDMWTGWGIRTMSSRERRYNPVGYHVGTVWPHDNALIAGGFRRYGFDDAAVSILEGMVDAAGHFDHDRLPEVFAGYARSEYTVPARYPVACHPQAWAAGSVPYLLDLCLGLEPDAFAHRLVIKRPVLPRRVRTLEIHRLRIGDASTDLRFERAADGTLAVRTLRVDGPLHVVIEPAPSASHR